MTANDYLIHHGIKGQRWGVRRYQNEDGTLTERGKKRIKKSGQNVYDEDLSIAKNGGKGDKFARGTEKLLLDRKAISNKTENGTAGIGGYFGTKLRDVAWSSAASAPAMIVGGILGGPVGETIAISGLAASYAAVGARAVTRLVDTVDFANLSAKGKTNDE